MRSCARMGQRNRSPISAGHKPPTSAPDAVTGTKANNNNGEKSRFEPAASGDV